LVSVMDEATDARTRRCYPLLYARYSFLQRKGAKRRPRGSRIHPLPPNKRPTFASATLAEKTRTPPRIFLWWCFSVGGSFPKPPSEREGDRDSGGRSLRDFGVLISFIVTRSPSVAFGASSLQEGAFVHHTSADSGFGLLPDGAWTATRSACPRRKRRASRKCEFAI